MMKKLSWLIATIVCLNLTTIAYAELIDVGNGVILDKSSGNYWYKSIKNLTNMTYSEQIAFISALNNNNSDHLSKKWGKWHLATKEEFDQLKKNNGAGELLSNFTPISIRKDTPGLTSWYASGRINEKSKKNEHIQWHVTKTKLEGVSPELAAIMGKGVGGIGYNKMTGPDDEKSNQLGAWVTASPVP